jgi:A/G-specific adenine glycosylase
MNSNKISTYVLNWYDNHRRTLPWRYPPGHKADPYKVWLSEIMLQQTQVDTVIPYFQRFVHQWSTVHDLANANQDEVLHQWQGLGYYSRARNLHACAAIIANDLKGLFPQTPEGLLQLPGIGPYTAAAIAAIAFNYPATVVDGNIARIISRLFGLTTPIKHNQTNIRSAAQSLTPQERPGDYAQALMDIGAALCTPRNPQCHACPMIRQCKAYQSGDPESFPSKAAKQSIPTRFAVAFISIKNDQVLLRKRSQQKMLNGLWELPGSDWYTDSLPELPHDLSEPYRDTKHTFSHFHLITRVVTTSAIEAEYLNGSEVYCNLKDLSALALSTLTKKILKNRVSLSYPTFIAAP